MHDCLIASFHRYAAKILGRKDKPFSTKDFCGAPVAQYRPIGAKRLFEAAGQRLGMVRPFATFRGCAFSWLFVPIVRPSGQISVVIQTKSGFCHRVTFGLFE